MNFLLRIFSKHVLLRRFLYVMKTIHAIAAVVALNVPVLSMQTRKTVMGQECKWDMFISNDRERPLGAKLL